MKNLEIHKERGAENRAILLGSLEIEVLKLIGVTDIRAFPAVITLEQLLDTFGMVDGILKLVSIEDVEPDEWKAFVFEETLPSRPGTIEVLMNHTSGVASGDVFILDTILTRKSWRSLAEMLSAEETLAD